jgi:membrane-associated HD superfamily phosphohydrolase
MEKLTELSLVVTMIAIIFMIRYLYKIRNNTKTHKCLYIMFILLEIYVLSMFAQITLRKYV